MKDYNKNLRNNPDQMVKQYVNGAFLEIIEPNIKGSDDDFTKVTFNFVTFDKQNKQTGLISCYMDIPEFLTLMTRISTGRYAVWNESAKNEALAKKCYPKSWYMTQGGNVKKDNANNTVVNAWTMEFTPTTTARNADVQIVAKKGEGSLLENGLITMKKAESLVRIPVSYLALENMANICLARINANITKQSIMGLFENKMRNKEPKQTLAQPRVSAQAPAPAVYENKFAQGFNNTQQLMQATPAPSASTFTANDIIIDTY